MRSSVFLFVVSLGLVAATAAAQPAYYPSGPQHNVLVTTVTGGGWTQCHLDTYAGSGADLSDILDGCSGEFMMLACRENGSESLYLLAAAPRSVVLTDTGDNADVTTNSNGSEWYFSDLRGSMGFAYDGRSVAKYTCDINEDPDSAERLCWHLEPDKLETGYRCGTVEGWPGDLNEDDSWDRIIYVYGAEPVPMVSRWQLLVLALLLTGAALAGRRVWVRGS